MNVPIYNKIVMLLICSALLLSMPGLCASAPAEDLVLAETYVTAIVIDNNRIIPVETLRHMTASFLNRTVSYVDLELLRNNLTQWVVQNGYINSGVIIPDQNVAEGIIHLAVVEGKVTTINVSGTRHFSKAYFSDRISRRTEAPFRISNLQELFQILYQDQRVTSINAELSGGLAPGESTLDLRVTEATPWQISLNATNDNSPSIGSYHGAIFVANRNLTGCGDTLDAGFGGSEGGYDYGAHYSRPLTAADTMLDVYFRKSEASVLDPLFSPLNINSNSSTYGGRLSHPLLRDIRRELRLSLAGEYRDSTNFLLGEGFSFSVHEKNGRSRFSVLRPGVEWVERRDGLVIVASTSVSTGITDESFTVWLAHLFWLQRTGILNSRIHFRSEVQLADTGLPPMEKYSLGGINSVRGYRKNVLVKDNSITASIEWWFPLVRDYVSGNEFLSMVTFADYGRGWDSGHETPGAGRGTDLFSLGAGVRWAWKGLTIDFFYGYGLLKSGITTGNDPQDKGIHFAATWNIL
jgi:hemolysin activation/secretion protein